ncbi:MAG: EAL domain-containing protein [Spirochaetales bacterium]|nr:EAL domain-containing protein [Spirochaetales bacterium]
MENIKVLFLSDHHYDSKILLESIRKAHRDYSILEVYDPITFSNIIVNGTADLIVILQDLPGKKGLDIMQNLRDESITVPFILIAENCENGIIRRFVDLGGLELISLNESRKSMTQKFMLTKLRLLKKQINDTEEYHHRVSSRYDALTGLPNRNELLHCLHGHGTKSLLLLDILHFGMLNNSYGLEAGDYILTNTSMILRQIVPAIIKVFRLDSDEFAILLDSPESNEATTLANNITKIFNTAKIVYKTIELRVAFTIGIAHGSGEDLIRHANIAIRRAREIGGNRYEFCSSSTQLEDQQKKNIKWASIIHRAIDNDEIVPFFQPIYNNRSGMIEKYECLARMLTEGKIITPEYFIGPARKAGLLQYLTKKMMEKSCEAMKGLPYEFSVNISEVDLRDHFLIKLVKKNLKRFNIEPSRLILEISDRLEITHCYEEIMQLKELKDMGVKIAFDDFGTGCSNYTRLMDLKADFIKIDGSFIKYLDTNENSYKISHAISTFGKSMNTQIIAEFVHSEEVFEKVRELNINYSQGYYFGHPDQHLPG